MRRLRDTVPLVPFLAFLVIFLVIPTITVVMGAVRNDNGFTLDKIRTLGSDAALKALWNSVLLSGTTAVLGAVFGALLCYLVVGSPPTSLFRRSVTSVCSVLAQFGGVALAFAFVATISFSGVVTVWLRDHMGLDIYGSGWLYEQPGLILVYTYFQIPLMVIVFLPALEGLRPQWREAAVNLGATPRQYWTQIGFPLLTPAFLGSMLLLFANAFAAYATAAALISQGGLTSLDIKTSLVSETVIGKANQAGILALAMVVVMIIVMVAYSALERRASRWRR
jgi:putative spermidine/putrescine transport system permease protein